MLSDQTPIPEAPKQKEEPEHKSRVDSVHGGKIVEIIETPEPMNNPDCEHVWEIDPTETDFIAYMCIKEDCGMIALYDK